MLSVCWSESKAKMFYNGYVSCNLLHCGVVVPRYCAPADDARLSSSLIVLNIYILHNIQSNYPASNREWAVMIIILVLFYIYFTAEYFRYSMSRASEMFWNNSIMAVPCVLENLSEKLQKSCFSQ